MESIGLISDTHGPLKTGVQELFGGVDRIVHAGDIVGESVLAELGELAPVIAVRGNMDHNEPSGRDLADKEIFRSGELTFCVVHDFRILTGSLKGIDVVLSGHTHIAEVGTDPRGVLSVNPGSAGKIKELGSPRSVARLEVEGREIAVEVLSLTGKILLSDSYSL